MTAGRPLTTRRVVKTVEGIPPEAVERGSLLVARIRTGPPTPASTDSWEIVADLPSGIAQVIAVRYTLAEAEAFADGWNLGVRTKS